MNPFNIRLRESNWEAVHGPRAFRRGQHMRAMAYDISELVQAHRSGKMNDTFCANYLWHYLQSAYFAFAWHWWARAHGNQETVTDHTGHVIEAEQLLDRAKGEIEYKLPLIAALHGLSRTELAKLIDDVLRSIRRTELADRKRYSARDNLREPKFDAAGVPLSVLLDFETWVKAAAGAITENVDDTSINHFSEERWF